MRKSLEKPWDMGNKIGGFYNEVEDFPIMFFGTSHAYCSFEPLVIYENTGNKSYVFSSQQQPLAISARYIKEAIRENNPKIIFVDIQALLLELQEDYSVVHSYADYMPLSVNKLEMILRNVPSEFKMQALLPFVSYHSRWDELTEEDYHITFSSYEDYLKGYVLLKNQSENFKNNVSDTDEKLKKFDYKKYISENINFIDEIIKIARENNLELYFVKTPIYYHDDPNTLEKINLISNHIREAQGTFINFNDYYDYLNLSKEDFYDPSHLNVHGAEKFNKFFSNFLIENNIVSKKVADDKLWLKDLEKYNFEKNKI